MARSRRGRTAYGAAAIRAMEAFQPPNLRLFEDHLVLQFLPRFGRFLLRRAWFRKPFAAMVERSAPGIRGALLCRTRAIDDAVQAAAARGLRAAVILGAGLDTRPYRLPELREAAVWEVDLPEVQAFKKARLVECFGALPAHVRFVAIDFDRERLDAALAAAGLGDTPAVFVWEGVTQYLQPEAVDAVLRVIAARPKGSELVFTYVLEDVIRGRRPVRQPEPWYFGIDPARLAAFLAERGLTLAEDAGATEHTARYLRPLGRRLAVSDIERVARVVV